MDVAGAHVSVNELDRERGLESCVSGFLDYDHNDERASESTDQKQHPGGQERCHRRSVIHASKSRFLQTRCDNEHVVPKEVPQSPVTS